MSTPYHLGTALGAYYRDDAAQWERTSLNTKLPAVYDAFLGAQERGTAAEKVRAAVAMAAIELAIAAYNAAMPLEKDAVFKFTGEKTRHDPATHTMYERFVTGTTDFIGIDVVFDAPDPRYALWHGTRLVLPERAYSRRGGRVVVAPARAMRMYSGHSQYIAGSPVAESAHTKLAEYVNECLATIVDDRVATFMIDNEIRDKIVFPEMVVAIVQPNLVQM